MGGLQRLGDRLKDAFAVRKNVIVPDPKHLKSLGAQVRVAHRICRRARVLAAIDFNDQPRFEAGKVNDVVIDWYLPAETISVGLSLAQRSP